ncbi:ribonuclease M5 [Fructobacillus sp. M1-13]|uniref:Ribonuclease M5 n=1 Tax=Fructobacillus papyriferae TaxID=2713171 RepID=A0ABS5QP51_9LACO|nr:ribonuclease M5 [Fructobacillus papyriferae]MBS9334939.1 ribonuclease M5 [Fructobacillus papyriferae]MCD2159577.1 ribonuclease M5 [Fructobacillus papyriferae]
MTEPKRAAAVDKKRPVIDAMVVVEGWSDTQRLALAVYCDTIETGGSALNQAVIERIALAEKKRGVIVLTDPDFNGNRLRQLILAAVPGVTLASISRDQGRAEKDNPHKSLGIEHAPIKALQEILQKADAKTKKQRKVSDIDQAFLLDCGLIGAGDAKKRRQILGDQLSIGYANGKQLLARLKALGFDKEEVIAALKGGPNGQND